MNYFLKLFFSLALLLNSNLLVIAQNDSLIKNCNQLFSSSYISDGQNYRAVINQDESAVFTVTFFGETIYRIIACSDSEESDLIFTLHDKDRHLLFKNVDFNYTPYWDFKFKSTTECLIEVRFKQPNITQRNITLYIGFKK